MPTFLVRPCLDELGHIIMKVVNDSLKVGLMPKALKSAIVTQLLKKTGLDRQLRYYMPVSNLAYSKNCN